MLKGWDSNNVNFRDHVSVGDLVIEGFVMCNYLTISVGHMKSRKPVTFMPTDKWGDMEAIAGKTICMSAETIPAYLRLIQNNGKSVIKKTWDKSKEYKFIKHREALFLLKAIDKLQATRWLVNPDVHEAILQQWDSFIKVEEFKGEDEKENDKAISTTSF